MEKHEEQTTEQTETATTPGVPTEVVELDTPIQRGSNKVKQITVRKPLSGALRGVGLVDLLNMDTASLQKVIPRISEPALTEAEVRKMDPADLLQIGGKVSVFLLGKRAQNEAE